MLKVIEEDKFRFIYSDENNCEYMITTNKDVGFMLLASKLVNKFKDIAPHPETNNYFAVLRGNSIIFVNSDKETIREYHVDRYYSFLAFWGWQIHAFLELKNNIQIDLATTPLGRFLKKYNLDLKTFAQICRMGERTIKGAYELERKIPNKGIDYTLKRFQKELKRTIELQNDIIESLRREE